MRYGAVSLQRMTDVYVEHKVMHVDKCNYKHKQTKIPPSIG
jgi:hypothetical protein